MFVFAFLNKLTEAFSDIGKSIKHSDKQALDELNRRANIDRHHEENVQRELRKYQKGKNVQHY